MDTTLDPELEALIEQVSLECRFDLRGYKRSTLYRRLHKRMQEAGARSVAEYREQLSTSPEEVDRLLATVLINVTEFFRDPEAWHYLQTECLPPRLEGWSEDPLRGWTTGCASGEEAYSLAIVLAELLPPARFAQVRIFATDVDEDSLSVARAGLFHADTLRNVDAARLERFFTPAGEDRYLIRPEIRSTVVFGRHNLLADPPISRVHLLLCRNLLIYYHSTAQAQMLERLRYALRPDGILFLGKAETPRSAAFRVLEPRYRLYELAPPEPAEP